MIVRIIKGAVKGSLKAFTVPIAFVHESLHHGNPPNLLAMVNTHADGFRSILQPSGGCPGESTNAGELIRTVIGMELLELMCGASQLARIPVLPLSLPLGGSAWCDISLSTQGGWRGLILASCGPAILSKHHFPQVVKLVKE